MSLTIAFVVYIEVIGIMCVGVVDMLGDEVWLIDPKVAFPPEGLGVDLWVCLALIGVI